VGVGTQGATYKFEVSGPIRSTATIYASSGNSDIWGYFPVVSTAATSFNVDSSYAYEYVRTTAATTVTATVVTAASAAWASNTEIIFEQAGAGQIFFNPSAGVTINTSQTRYTEKQYAVVTLKYVAADTWTLFGERQLA
jgi:hypothetical protein